jgi:hypothetical protein
MKLHISNKLDESKAIVDIIAIKHELAHQLAEYMIANNLVDFRIEKGDMIVSVCVEKPKRDEDTDER